MRNARFFFSSLFVVACGGAPPPTPVTVAPRPIPTTAVAQPPAKVEAPHDLVAWMHVEHPARLAALIDRISGPAGADASCATGDLRACIALGDAERPLDAAVTLTDWSDDAEAIAFSVHDRDTFRTRASASFDVKEISLGRLELVAKKKNVTFDCDVSRADGPTHRVVCGQAPGLLRLGAWLATSPEPPSRDGLARVEIYRKPLVTAAEKHWAADSDTHREVRALAHDFDGATLTLEAGDDATAQATLDLDVRVRDTQAHWTRALLAPAAAAQVPATFARLAPDSTGTIFVPGGTALVSVLDLAGVFDEVASFAGKPVVDDLRVLLGRPMACGYVVELGGAHAALANVRKASGKDQEKAHAALDAALSGHAVCGVRQAAKSIEALARKLVRLAPTSGDRYAVRSATSLGLPAGSFLVETTHAPKPGAKGPSKDTTLAVPDDDTTWLVFADEGADVTRAAHAMKRVLSRPTTATNGLALAPPGTLLAGDATTLLGAFFWDLAMHSYDEIEKTLAITSPERLNFVLAQHPASPGGSLTLHLAAPVAALPKFAARGSALLLPLGIFAAALFSSDAPSTKP